MNYKEKLITNAEEILEIGQKNQISTAILKDLKKLKKEISDFTIKVPLMGGFNAGKTSLLNAYLGEDKLPTNIRPETAIATELKYCLEEKIIAHKEDGSTEEYSLSQIDNLNDDYLFIEVFQNNIKLKGLEDIVLIDMPGLDSSLELHNRAIMNYIDEGVFYIVIADVNHGLKETVIDFLRELDVYNLNFAVLLNKSDLKPDSQVKEVVDSTTSIVRRLAGSDVFVGSISAKEEEMDDFNEVIKSLDKDNLLKTEFKEQVLSIINELISQLEMRINFQKVDTSEIDNKIREIEKSITDVERKVAEEKTRIGNQFSAKTPDKILKDVRNALADNMDRLVQVAKTGQNNFSRTVSQIIRPVLVNSSQENIKVVLQESFDNISAELEEVSNLVRDMLLTSPDAPQDGSILNGLKLSQKNNVAFKAILGSLGITTTVIAPWIHVIVFFLPEIFKLLGKLGNLMGYKDYKIKKQIQTMVIPDIMDQLRPKVQSSLDETNQKFISQVNNEVEKEKEQLVAALNKAKEEKKMTKEEFASKKEEFKKDIKRVETIKESL